MKKFIEMKKNYILILLLLGFGLLSAHEPAEMKVKYSALTGSLSITVYHKVNSTSVHYIKRLEIYLNRQNKELQDKLIISQEFFSQPIRNEQRAHYIVNDLNPGDALRIVAYCNLFGQLEEKLIITEANWQELAEP
ncbi:MAG: hypothetical protein K9N06_01730 [Candidatus Cloacimonetes bacterium]|nr:hypothetical protein [Candidatus Cloacimonadota bacterium]